MSKRESVGPMDDSNVIESRIEDYIRAQALARGSLLPEESRFAAELGCDREALVEALRAAEVNEKLTHDTQGWLVRAIPDHYPMSFRTSAESHGHKVKTDVLEVRIRAPLGDKEHPFYDAERIAHTALGLEASQPFLIIERFRLLDGVPSALQRAYLDPRRFAEDLPTRDFGQESLLRVYAENGYGRFIRDTVLRARGANVYETNLLAVRYKQNPHGRVVLDGEQFTHATDQAGKQFVVEFLKASYMENWKYEIKNRPAG